MRRRAPAFLLLEVDVGERLPIVIADDEALPAELGIRRPTWAGRGGAEN
jgi:hypothetical protein